MSATDVSQLLGAMHSWLQASSDWLRRNPSADTSPELQAISQFARRELAHFAASVNERNALVSLPATVLSRILSFTGVSDCVRVSQTCKLLHSKLLEMPQLWATVFGADGTPLADDSAWRPSDDSIAALIQRSDPEPLARLRLVWGPNRSDAFTRLLDDALLRLRALSVTASPRSVGIWRWNMYLPPLVDPRQEESPSSAASMMRALAAPAPLLESFYIAMIEHPFVEADDGPCTLPANLFDGECTGRLRTCGLTNVGLPRAGCPALADVRALDWRTDHRVLYRDDLLTVLDCFPLLETLRIVASEIEWSLEPLAVPRYVQNVHLDVPRVVNVATLVGDIGAERFVFDELTLDPETRLFDELAASGAFEMLTLLAGERLCEAATRFHGRALSVRCHPAEPFEYFAGRLPCIPAVPSLDTLTLLGLHEFFWPGTVPDDGAERVTPPRFPALRELRIFLASCADYSADPNDVAGVLQQADLVRLKTPALEAVHLSYTLVDACGAAGATSPTFWRRHFERALVDDAGLAACSCRAVLGVSLLDVHGFLVGTVLAGPENPRRLRSLALTGMGCSDWDGGAEGMTLLTALADDVRVSPDSEPTNCDVSADIWWTSELGHMFRDSLL